MPLTRLLITAPLLLLLGCPSTGTGTPPPNEEVSDPTWTSDVEPILGDYCSGCHEGDAVGSGGIGWLNSYLEVTAVAASSACDGASRAECIPGRIERGEMPLGAPCTPGDSGCITVEQLQTVQNWIDGGMAE